MKMNKKLVSFVAVLALLVTLGCGAIIAAAAGTPTVDLSLSYMEDGLTVVNVSLANTEKTVDYVQLQLTPKTAAATPVAGSASTAVSSLSVTDNLTDGVYTVLAIPSADGVAMANGTVAFSFQVADTANGDVLEYTGSYVLCYTDGESDEGALTDSITVKGNMTTRLEAETDAVYWIYEKIEDNAAKNGKEVGGVWDNTALDPYRQSYEELANGTESLHKGGNPMMSFIVDVAEEGDYSLDVVFRGSLTAGSLEDFFMALCVDDVTSSYVKAFYTSAHPTISGYNIANGTIHLTEGRHVIRVITMLADTRSTELYMKWLNIDFVDVKGPGELNPVTPQWTHLSASDAFNAGMTAQFEGISTELNSGYGDWWANSLGSFRGDNNVTSSEGFTMDSLSKLGYAAYTVNVPADGFYDLQTYIRRNYNTTGIGNIFLIVDDQIHKFSVLSPTSKDLEKGIIKWNAQNLSCYLTKGVHTLIVTGVVDYTQSSKNWCDMGALSVSGGITIAEYQIPPQSISIAKTGNTLLLENMVQNKYQFSVEGESYVASSGLLVWRGEKLTSNDGTFLAGSESYVVEDISDVDGTIKALGIAAKEQGDDIKARGFVVDGNGTYYYSDLIDFNATAYAAAAFADTAGTDLQLARPTVAAMLNYFGKAQRYFEYESNGYMDAITIPDGIDLTYDANNVVPAGDAPTHSFSNPFTVKIYHSLELEDNAWLKYIVPKGSMPEGTTKLLVWEKGEDLTLANATMLDMEVNGSYYTAAIKGIAPKDMDTVFYTCVYYNDGTDHYSQMDAYSIHQYAANMIAGNSNTALVELCKALVTYSSMADNYFASLNADVIYVSNAGGVYNSGATAADATDWQTALYKVKDGGTLYMVDYVMSADSWPAHTKSVTLQGSLDASALTTLNINGPTTFGAVTLKVADGADVFANGKTVVISENATVTGVPMLFGATQANSTLTSTNLTVLSGTYTRIYGGGVRGTVGTINLTVGGNAVTDWVYGGGAKVSGDWCDFTTVNVTIEGNAKLNEGVYGGNKYGPGIAGCTVNVTINGGTMEAVFGGQEWSDTGKSAAWGGENINLNGDINIYLNGGTITRRVIGGSYNEYGITSGWESSRHVLGNITLYISDNVTMNCTGDDYGIIAGSRYGDAFDDETTKIVFTSQSAYDKYYGELGLYWTLGTLTSAAESCDNYSTLAADIQQ